MKLLVYFLNHFAIRRDLYRLMNDSSDSLSQELQFIIELPDDLLIIIQNLLNNKDWLHFRKTCKRIYYCFNYHDLMLRISHGRRILPEEIWLDKYQKGRRIYRRLNTMRSTKNKGQIICQMRTSQISIWKIILEALSKTLTTVNLIWKPDGLFLQKLDQYDTIILKLFFPANKFTYYSCQQETIAGLSLPELYKLTRFWGSNSLMTWTIYSNSPEIMEINLFDTSEDLISSQITFRLLDLVQDDIYYDWKKEKVITVSSQTRTLSKYLRLFHLSSRNDRSYLEFSTIAGDLVIANENHEVCSQVVITSNEKLKNQYLGKYHSTILKSMIIPLSSICRYVQMSFVDNELLMRWDTPFGTIKLLTCRVNNS